MEITEGKLFNTLYAIVNSIFNGNYIEEYTMNYSMSGPRDCNINHGLTKVYKSSVVLCRTDTNIRFMHYKRNWNLYVSQYNKRGFGELYIKYNGTMYYYQPAMRNAWHTEIPTMFIVIDDNCEKLIANLRDAIYYGRGCKTTKKMLLAFESFLDCGNRLEERDKERKIKNNRI